MLSNDCSVSSFTAESIDADDSTAADSEHLTHCFCFSHKHKHIYVKVKVKVKELIAVSGTPSHSYGVSLAVWDHTVLPSTRHKLMHPTFTPARQAGT